MYNCGNSEEAKLIGNEMFKRNDYENAYKYYTIAIEMYENLKIKLNNDSLSTYYANRANVLFNQNKFKEVIEDCDKSISLNYLNVKSYYRKAKAFINLKEFGKAKETLEKCKLINIDYPEIDNLLKEISK